MNAEDLKLMNNLLSRISGLDNQNKMLFLADYGHIAKTNLILLKALLEELDKKGLFITVDRPHQYMEHLLRMHKVNYTSLFFLDTITYFSGAFNNQNINGKNVKILNSPFQIDILPDLLSFSTNNNELNNKINVNGLDFILIDNVASMLNYNDLATVEEFLEKFINKFNGMNRIFLPIIIDKLTHGSLYIFAKKYFDVEVDINLLGKDEIKKSYQDHNFSFPPHQGNTPDWFSAQKKFPGGY